MSRSALHVGLRICCTALAIFFSATAMAEETPQVLVEPSQLTLRGPYDSAQMIAGLPLADGAQRDVTRQAVWQSADENVARVAAGRVEPAGNGSTVLTVTVSDAERGTLTATIPVSVSEFDVEAPLNFRRDVEPILTKYGCNSGGCHGKLAGQNGFRLSLFGFDPEADYTALTKEARGRRVFPLAPEHSLLLTKASGGLPHGGGRRFDPDSAPYRTLRRWIEQGLPWGEEGLADLVRIEATPRQRVMRRGESQQLRVVLHYRDGSTKDITAEAEYRSQRAEVLQADADGFVTARDVPGEGTVLIRYLGMVDIARFSVPFSEQTPPEAYRHFEPANVIDELALAKWRTLGIVPSELSSDHEFLRRVYLDCIGTLPQPQEVRDFLADTAPDKRARLIDRLLERPEFVDYWALQLGDLLQNRKERDGDVRGVKGVRQLHAWLRQQIAMNRPWNEIARAVLTVTGDSFNEPTIGYYVVNMGGQSAEQSELITSVAQAFLGTRLGCAKCHNHPLEKYTQDDYYHFAAFFSRVKLERRSAEQGPIKLTVSARDPNENDKPVGVIQPRTGAFMAPQTLEREPVEVDPKEDPRQKLVGWVTDPSNEYFAGAMVNRLVRHFLGYGLVEPVDDLRATNPPTNQELWDALNKEFVGHQYDLRHLMKLILNSRTYQLSSVTRPDNATDQQFYSHYYARRLPAEVMLDAICQSTGVAEHFPGYPLGVRAIQLPDPGLNSYFLSVFGRSPRTTACACERNGEVTLSQLLHLQNGESVVQKIKAPHGRLAQLQTPGAELKQVVDELFLATLARYPDEREWQAVQTALAGDQQGEGLVDLFWALLNSKEFGFNH